ncbi:MAG: methyltransferase family protein [Alphaproteobacteria bacterium]
MTEPRKHAVLRAILILPGSALVVVPALILWSSAGTVYAGALASAAGPVFWLALVLVAVGLWLMARTIAMFASVGKGTLAPWQPTQRLVVTGVYRHVRNPMISGVFAALLGETLLAQSLPLAAWAALFAAANLVYIPLFEEPGLARRFGDDYRAYKANVPRWLPRLTPWKGIDEG